MTIPVYVVIAQWALLLALSALVIILYRQLGRALGHEPVRKFGPETGSRAAGVEYLRLSDQSSQYWSPGGGQATMLAFVEPSCRSCSELVTALEAAEEAGELAGLRVLLLTSDPPRYLELSDTFANTSLELGRIVMRSTSKTYGVSATPLAVAVDRQGTVRRAGPARDLADLLSFRQACLANSPEDAHHAVPASVSQGHADSHGSPDQ